MHPYDEYEGTRLWQVIETVLAELIENQDLELTTSYEYVAGYICKRLDHLGLLAEGWRRPIEKD